MKREISFCGIRFGRFYAIVFISVLLIMYSCKSEEVKKLEKFIGEYDVNYDWCDNSSLVITSFGDYLEIKNRTTGGIGIELNFRLDKNNYKTTQAWWGSVSNDTLIIYRQTPLSNTDAIYKPTYTVSGYGVIHGDSLKFVIDQQGASTRDGICTFSAKRK
jgi:hypothetical protein